jgi:aromatic ring hydroxylase
MPRASRAGQGDCTGRFLEYLHRVQDQDLALGVAMTDAKGDRSLRPHEQARADTYVHIIERHASNNGRRGIVISGAKAIVTGAPYVHELLVMPCRNMGAEDADFAVCCAVPVDAPGLTIIARPAGRPGERLEHGEALFSRKYSQSTAVCIFDRVFVPWENVFFAGEWEHSGHLTYSYATQHRHTCIGARAGFGDLLIGAGALMAITLPGPDKDHNPQTAGRLSELLQASADVPCAERIQVARLIEDLTAGYQGGWYSVISLHGGGSPAAMKQEIYRNYPIGSKVELVERLLERSRSKPRSDPTGNPASAATWAAPRPASP